MRPVVIVLLLLAAPVLALPAVAGDRFGPSGRHRSGLSRATGIASPGDRARSQRDALRIHTERRKAEAGVRLLEQHRDMQRRMVETDLRRGGTPAQVRAYRARLEARERTDDLRIRQRLQEVDPDWWNGLGPNTRRVFEDSGFVVRRAQRRQELRRELDALEREAENREPPPSW